MVNLPQLSRSELDLMKILWKNGESTVRDVHNLLGGDYDWAYSTTRTMMERMVKKGFVERRDFHGVYLYLPSISKPAGLAGYVREFAGRILELNHRAVLPLFTGSETLTPEEIEELSSLLDEAEAMDREGDSGEAGDV